MVSLLTVKNPKKPETSFAAKQMKTSLPVILIVEDDEDSRLMLKMFLETWNYLVIEAENGKVAVWIAEKIRPDLILMDVKLPYLDGFDATRRIRESAKGGSVPVVFLSGCAEANYKNAESAAGGNEYLVKPLDFEELRSVLGKYIHH